MTTQRSALGIVVIISALMVVGAVDFLPSGGGPIASGETKSGTISAPTYKESWTFSGVEGERVEIAVVPTSGALDTEIWLYPATGPAEASTGGVRLDHVLEQTSAYTIVVQDYALDHAGDYMISFLTMLGAVSSPADPDGGPIVSGQTSGGQINAASDMDAFQFEGTAGHQAVITVVPTSGALDSEIWLYPPDGGEAEVSTGGIRLDHTLERTGLYTAIVIDYAADHVGAYKITFLEIPGNTSSPADPDGGAIASGQTQGGQMNAASDMDAFQFEGTAGHQAVITVVPTSGALDSEIWLYPPDGGDAETSTGGIRLDHTLERTGLYTAIVVDYAADHVGVYKITYLEIPGNTSSLADPDGGAIASGQTLAGQINVASDMDAYQFDGTAGHQALITVVPTSGALDSEIWLYPPDGGDAEASTGGVRLDHTLERTGLYTAVIVDYAADHVGTYRINFLKIPGPVSCPDDLDGGAFASAATVIGAVDFPSDMDAFYFFGRWGDQVTVTLVDHSDNIDPVFWLFPPGGGPAEFQTGGDQLDHQLEHPGLYTLVIQDGYGEHTGGYTLHLGMTPSDPAPGLYEPFPPDEAMNVHPDGTFTWQPVGGATGYDVYFGRGVIVTLDLVGEDVAEPTLPIPAVETGSVYYWHVQVHRPQGDLDGPYWWFVPVECSACIIGGLCYGEGEANPNNVCQICDSDESVSGWSNAEGAACDDGVFCNGEDSCAAGQCVVHGGNPCGPDEHCDETQDRCVPQSDDDGDDDMDDDGDDDADSDDDSSADHGSDEDEAAFDRLPGCWNF